MRIRTLLNLFLTAEAALALLSFAICAAFIADAPVLGRIDRFVKDLRIDAPRRHLDEIVAAWLAGGDRAATIGELEALLGELSHVQKTDAAQATRRGAFAAIVGLLREEQAFARALDWCNAWLEFDPLDLHARAERASLLMLDPATRDEGRAVFASLAARFPESLPLADIRASAYGQLGELDNAFRALAPFLPGSRPDAGPALPRIGAPFAHPLETHFLAGRTEVLPAYFWIPEKGRWRLRVVSPASFEQLRIVLPQSETLDVRIVEADAAIQVHPVGLSVTGPDAYRKSYYTNASLIIDGAPGNLVLEVNAAPPPTLGILVSPAVLPTLRASLAGDADALRLLDAARAIYADHS